MINRNQLIQLLKDSQGIKSQKEFSSAIGCSPSHLSDIYSGKRDPGENLLNKLGYSKVVLYIKAEVAIRSNHET